MLVTSKLTYKWRDTIPQVFWIFIMRVLHLSQSEAELLTQIFGDLASLDLDEKYDGDFESGLYNKLWDKVCKL